MLYRLKACLKKIHFIILTIYQIISYSEFVSLQLLICLETMQYYRLARGKMLNSQDSDEQDKLHQKYTKLQKVAEGTYGIVWKARNKQTSMMTAIKVFKNINAQGLPTSAIRQIHLLKKITSPYVLQPLQLDIGPQKISMVSVWKQISLNNLIKSKSSYNTKSIMRQLLKAVDSIHENMVMHRDLKPANIVLDSGDGESLKLIDFGMGKEIKWKQNCSLTNEVGTLYYRAPELLDGSTRYTKTIDIWAVGCIFYELLTGQILFKQDNEFDQLIRIYEEVGSNQEKEKFLQNHQQVEEIEANDWKKIQQTMSTIQNYQSSLSLLKKLLEIIPEKRFSCKQALSHHYFNSE